MSHKDAIMNLNFNDMHDPFASKNDFEDELRNSSCANDVLMEDVIDVMADELHNGGRRHVTLGNESDEEELERAAQRDSRESIELEIDRDRDESDQKMMEEGDVVTVPEEFKDKDKDGQ